MALPCWQKEMNMTVCYEWDCEIVADIESDDFEDNEVIEHIHGDSYKWVREWSANNPCGSGRRYDIVLVRDDDNGRSWAYIEDGKLPEYFTDAFDRVTAKVPKRFVQELAQ